MSLPRPPKRRKIPPLSPDKLELALQKLALLPIPDAAKAQLAAMLQAASNAHSEAPDVVMKTMPRERQADMEATIQALDGVMSAQAKRGGAALLAMDDDEWNALVREANTSE